MSELNNLSVGDRVRVRYGNHAGELATITNITWHSNSYGSYARVHISFDEGGTNERSMGDLEKVEDDLTRTAAAGR